ncbi:MAG: ribokinase [Caldilineaceae bacterium]
MPTITVIGSFVAALTIRVPRVPALGESLVGNSLDLGPGGKGSNQAIAAARLGAAVHLVACVGDDLFAPLAFDLYAREGIATDHIHRLAGAPTGVAMINVLPSGENWITVDPGANLAMTAAHVDALAGYIAQSDLVMAQLEIGDEPVAQAMNLGRAYGVRTLLNPAPARPLPASLLAQVDLLTPNATEARILLGLPPDDPTPTPALAQRLLELGVKEIVVTQGAAGALIVTPTEMLAVPSVPVQAVDVTGAGDSFNAALAVGLSEGLPLAAAVQQACRAGAYTTQTLGVIPALPTRAQLAAFR